MSRRTPLNRLNVILAVLSGPRGAALLVDQDRSPAPAVYAAADSAWLQQIKQSHIARLPLTRSAQVMPFTRVQQQRGCVYVGSKNPVKVAAVRHALRIAFPGQQQLVQAVPSKSSVPDQPFGEDETKQGAINRVSYMRRHLHVPPWTAPGGDPSSVACSPQPHGQQQRPQQQQAVLGSPPLQGPHQESPAEVPQEGVPEGEGEPPKLLLEEEVLLVAVEGGVMWRNTQDLTCFAWVAVQRVTPETAADNSATQVSLARSSEFLLPAAVAQLVASGMELGQADDQVFGRVQSGQGTGTVGHLTHGAITRQSYYEHAVSLALIPYLHPPVLYPGY